MYYFPMTVKSIHAKLLNELVNTNNKEGTKMKHKKQDRFGELLETKREQFWRKVNQTREGISAEREKLPMGLKTTTPKFLDSNKEDN